MRVALVGCGRWGRNLLRELQSHPLVHLVLVVDPDADARDHAAHSAPQALVGPRLEAVEDLSLDAAVVATPGPLHYQHAAQLIARGLHVLVEKPLATCSRDARELVALARHHRVIGMVGHLLHYHNAVRAMIELARSGALGAVRELRSDRFATAAVDVDGSVLWSLAPHDVSVLMALDPGPVRVVRSETRTKGQAQMADIELQTSSGVRARLSLCRGNERKVRRMAVVCDLATIVFDDCLGPTQKLRVMNAAGEDLRNVAWRPEPQPLAAEVDAFVRAVSQGSSASPSFEQGAAVVELIERLERGTRAVSAQPSVA